MAAKYSTIWMITIYLTTPLLMGIKSCFQALTFKLYTTCLSTYELCMYLFKRIHTHTHTHTHDKIFPETKLLRQSIHALEKFDR